MNHLLFTAAIVSLLAGCAEKEQDYKEVSSATNTIIKTEAPAAPELTEEVKAEIEKTYGLTKPTELPTKNVSVDVGISYAEPLFNLHTIANKSEQEVTGTLGKPTEKEMGNWTLMPSKKKTPFVRNVYAHKADTIEVMFIEGKAVRIGLQPKEAFKYPDDAEKAMRAAGLAIENGIRPDNEAPHFLQYEGIDGFLFVRVVKDLEGNPENILEVKIVTEERYK